MMLKVLIIVAVLAVVLLTETRAEGACPEGFVVKDTLFCCTDNTFRNSALI